LAFAWEHHPGPDLVVVATLSPEPCQLLPYQTSPQGNLICVFPSPTGSGSIPLFPDFLEISGKCRSSEIFLELWFRLISSGVHAQKGVFLMAAFPLAQAAGLLGLHPKTLHHWLKEAHIPLVAHPTDARIKCVTLEHLQEVAKRHGRPLSGLLPVPLLEKGGVPDVLGVSANEAKPDQMTVPSVSLADVVQRVSCLETKIGTLQEQLAGLALALLQERERAVEHRIAALETLTQQLRVRPSPSEFPVQESACPSHPVRQPLLAERYASSRLPALIEYSAQGIYVIISSQEGELHLVPDSAEWFAWLETIPSFRFVGQQGRFTAYRHSRFSRSWRAHRVIHQQNYKQTLGVTDHLTLHRLEQVAAALQLNVAPL
jgi:hypothetical protein